MHHPSRLVIPALVCAACAAPASSPKAGPAADTTVATASVPALAGDTPEAGGGGEGTASLPPAPATSSPAPLSSASAAAQASRRVTIKPLATSKLLSKRDLALFNSVCQLAQTPKRVGCRCCPDDLAAKWCAEQTGDPMTSIEHVFYGGFSRPGAKEAYSCGNLSAWGANWFFRYDGNRWTVVSGTGYAHHVLHGTVWDLADGRRGLVSHDVISKGFSEAIAFTTFAADGTPSRAELLGWSNSACIHRVAGFYQAVVIYVGANPFDHNKDGKRDLVISLDVKRRFADAAFEKECSARFNQPNAPSPFDRVRAKRHVIPLLFDGSRFTPEAAALARLDKATAEVDKHGKPFQP